jgi:arabinoxylan arabinofuranohydrolase
MKEWRLYSSCDMKNWTEPRFAGPLHDLQVGRRDAWASDITKRNGKYYFYATVDHATIPGKAIGVAVSDSPKVRSSTRAARRWSPTT